MNIISIVSVCIAFFSFIFTIIYNTNNIKRSREKETQDLLKIIKQESIEKGETKSLFESMNKNLERIVEDNKIMNERIYALAERVTSLELNQKTIVDNLKEIPIIKHELNSTHEKVNLLEHDIKSK